MPSEMDLCDKRNMFKWRYDRRSGNCNLSKGIRTHCLCVSNAVLYQLSYADPCIGSRQIGWVHSFHGLNWPAPNVWVSMAHLVESAAALTQRPWVRYSADTLTRKYFGTLTGFEPMAFALALQCSTNGAMQTHTLGAGKLVEFIPFTG